MTSRKVGTALSSIPPKACNMASMTLYKEKLVENYLADKGSTLRKQPSTAVDHGNGSVEPGTGKYWRGKAGGKHSKTKPNWREVVWGEVVRPGTGVS